MKNPFSRINDPVDFDDSLNESRDANEDDDMEVIDDTYETVDDKPYVIIVKTMFSKGSVKSIL